MNDPTNLGTVQQPVIRDYFVHSFLLCCTRHQRRFYIEFSFLSFFFSLIQMLHPRVTNRASGVTLSVTVDDAGPRPMCFSKDYLLLPNLPELQAI